MAIEIREFVGDDNIQHVNEADVTKKTKKVPARKNKTKKENPKK